MKKLILIAAALLTFQYWDSLQRYLGAPSEYAAMQRAPVVLYATSRCGYCQKARELMAKHRIEYYEYDIDRSADGRKQHAELGGKGVPVLLIGGEVVHGYNAKKILELTGKS